MTNNNRSNTSRTRAAPQDRNIFRFFDLPGEICNSIYDEALLNIDTQHCCLKLEGQCLAPSALTVSKRFSKEYRSRVVEQTHLTITENKKCIKRAFDDSAHIALRLPRTAKSLATLQLKLHVALPIHLVLHAKWAEPLLRKLDTVGQVKMQFNNLTVSSAQLAAKDYAEKVRQALNDGFWTQVPRLVLIEIYNVPCQGFRQWNFDERVLHAKLELYR